MEEEKEVIPGYKSVEDFTKEGFKALMGAIKSSNALPSDKDFDFYKVHESFERLMNVNSDKLLGLMNNLLRKQGILHNFRSRGLEDKVELLVEANDVVLERAANGIDEMNGIKNNVSGESELQTVSTVLPINGSWNRSDKAKVSFGTSGGVEPATTAYRRSKFYSVKLLTANIAKPQDFFTVKVDNSNELWAPRIPEKPNSIKPLAFFVEDTEDGLSYSHPYEFELDHFEPSAEHLKVIENPEPPKSLHCTPLVQVSLPEQLDQLVEDLRKYSEFAIDVEHHSYRSFMGITCLIQISTVDTDYLIDTITLRDRLWVLNEVFTKPSIVKILHGADLDILWLQRDLSLYIVNMFDTHLAARQLHYPHGTLAYLLKRFCAIEIDKKFQLADWRVRPLSDEHKSYARMDSHYLIYVYHLLKKELLTYANGSSNLIRVVFHNSTNICKRRFTKPRMTENSYLEFYKGCKRAFNNQQMYALQKLYEWRDWIARKEDESTGYVLPNHMLLQICEKLPREIQSLLACCNPVPPLLRTHIVHLHNIILTAKRQPLEKEILKHDNRGRGSTVQFNRLNIDSPLYCPHDLPRAPEFRNDLPTLLNRNNYNYRADRLPIEKRKPAVSVFGYSQNQNQNPVHKTRRVKFMSPYQRYKSVKPFIRDEEEKAATAAKEAAQNNNAAPQTPTADLVDAHDNVHTEPTDEERIEGIHKHFIKEAQTTPQIQPKSLVEMGGTKKRKRTEDEWRQHDDRVPNNELHTPVPNLRGTRFNRGKKRKQSNSPIGNQQTNPNANQQNNWNDRQRKLNPNQQRNRSPGQQINRSPGQQRNRSPNQQHNQNYNQQTSANPNQQEGNQNRNRKIIRNRNKYQHQDNAQKDHCQAFDYTKVDYQQFQGGSSRVNTGQTVQSKFKGKNKPKKAHRNPANTSGKFFRQATPNKTNNTSNKNV